MTLSREEIAKKCIPGDNTTPTLAEAACEAINLEVVGFITGEDIGEVDFSETNIIAAGDYMFLVVLINYDGDARADGDFSVEFGDINLLFSTAG